MLEVGYKVSKSVFPQFPIELGLDTPLTVNLSVVEQTPDDFFEITYRPIPLSLEGEDLLPPQITVGLEPEQPGLVVSGPNPLYVNVGRDPINLSVDDGLLDRLAEISFDGTGPLTPTGTPDPVQISFSVSNGAEQSWMTERTETIRASVPFPSGEYLVSDLNNLAVSGKQTCWLPLQYWGDNSVKIAQAQITDTLNRLDSSSYNLVSSTGIAYQGTFTRHPWNAGDLEVGALVTDAFDNEYAAFASGSGEIVQSTGMVQTKRYRVYHQPLEAEGLDRDFLTSMFYITEFKDMPVTVVDWIVGNDYSGIDSPGASTDPNNFPLGSIDVNKAYFLASGTDLNTGVAGRTEMFPYNSTSEGISTSSNLSKYPDHVAHEVMSSTFIADGQTRRYRFFVKHLPSNPTNSQVYPLQRTVASIRSYPMFALASFDSWKQSKAAGLFGGPIAGPADSLQRAKNELNNWKTKDFGTWGDRGDPKYTNQTGTPRNQPITEPFAHTIQSQYHRLVEKLEGQAWIQSARPYHLYGLEVGSSQQILLYEGLPLFNDAYFGTGFEVLGRRPFIRKQLNGNAAGAVDPYHAYRTRVYTTNLNLPEEDLSAEAVPYRQLGSIHAHGWKAYDPEHFTVDLLFDYFTMTGDPWAKEELRQLGHNAMGMLRIDGDAAFFVGNMQAARTEGWTMQAWAQCYQATQEQAFKDYAYRRANEVVDAQRNKTHASKAVTFQQNYNGINWPQTNKFFMPWQHGAILYGFIGAYLCFDENLYLTIAKDVVTTVDYSWVSGVTDTKFGYIEDGLRYYGAVEGPPGEPPARTNGLTSEPVSVGYFDYLSEDGFPAPGFGEIGGRFGDSPLGGAHTFLTGGLLQLADLITEPSIINDANYYGEIILRGGNGLTFSDDSRWNKWVYVIPHDIT